MSQVTNLIFNLKPILIILYIGIMGLACTSAVSFYFKSPPSILVGVIFMSFVFFIYTINQFTDLKEDFTNDIQKAVFFTKNKFIFKVGILVIAITFASLIFFHKLNAFHLILTFAGLAYSYKILPWYSKNKGIFYYRIKEIPFLKNISVAILWGTSIFIIPILFSDILIINSVVLYTLICSLVVSTFINTLFDDILDYKGDLVSGTKTLPTLYGNSFCYKILLFTSIVWIATICLLFAFSIIDGYHLLFSLTLTLYPIVYITGHIKNWFKKGFLDVLMEMDLILFALGLLCLGLAHS